MSFIGEMKPLHLSGAGKAMLSYWPENQFQAYLAHPLDIRTERTISTPEGLIECRQKTRLRGYALDDEEGEKGVFCIGVPVFVNGGILYAGLSVSMLKSVVETEEREKYISKMLQAGELLSRKMGYQGEYPLLD